VKIGGGGWLLPACLQSTLVGKGMTMMDWRSWGVLLAGVICFGSFSWAVKFHFQKSGESPRGMQAVSVLSVVAFAWFICGLVTRPGGYRVVPFGLCALSLLLFWWCILHTRSTPFTLAFSLDLPAFLDSQGPYRVARHPFYLSYLLFWVATALAVPGALSWVAPVVMSALYTLAATREEAKFANGVLDGQYRAYRTQTGMFFPLLMGLRRREGQA